jgi:hypothetical protein
MKVSAIQLRPASRPGFELKYLRGGYDDSAELGDAACTLFAALRRAWRVAWAGRPDGAGDHRFVAAPRSRRDRGATWSFGHVFCDRRR